MPEYNSDTLNLDLLVGDPFENYYNYFEMDYGYADTESTAFVQLFGGEANYDLGLTDKATVSAVSSAGWGSWRGVAKVGKQFSVTGTEAKEVNMEYRGRAKGHLTAFGNSSSSVNIQFILRNMDTGEDYEFEIFDKTASRIGWDYLNFSINSTESIYLRPEDTYLAVMRLEGTVQERGGGLAGSDWGPADGDDTDEDPVEQGVRFEQLLVRP